MIRICSTAKRVPLLGTSSVRRKLAPGHCLFQAVAHAVLLLVACGGPPAALAEDSSGAEGLVGSRVDITLRSGKVLRGVTIVEVRPGDVHGTVATLRVYDPAKQLRSVLGASAIQRVATADGTVLLAFDKKSQTLAPTDPEKLAEIRKAASAGPKDSAGPASRAAPGEDAARRKQKEAQRQEFFKKTGVMPWAELSDEEQKAEIEKEKAFLKKVAEHFPSLNMRLSETKYFLILSALPPAQTAVCEPSLDTTHKELCQAYAIENPDKLWLGKGAVRDLHPAGGLHAIRADVLSHQSAGERARGQQQ